MPDVLEFIRVATQHSQVASGMLLVERPVANVQGSEARWAAELTSKSTPEREATEIQASQPPLGPVVGIAFGPAELDPVATLIALLDSSFPGSHLSTSSHVDSNR